MRFDTKEGERLVEMNSTLKRMKKQLVSMTYKGIEVSRREGSF